ncbi:MAG: S8 family serine peptidase [Candidatus Poseidoniaceae archaeon]|nr:S8 family serine peptidase [Candidatus Poseidoniaceae archaeon]
MDGVDAFYAKALVPVQRRSTMHNRSARSLLVVCTLQLLLIGVSAAPLADGLNPLGDFERMDAALENELNSVDDQAVLSVIFQLNSEVLPEDLLHFEELGAEILGDAPLIDGGLLEATSLAIRTISQWERVEYLELNRELEFFYLPAEFGGEPTDPGIMMHETTHVVNATTSWHRAIINTDGTVAFDMDMAFTEWDGDGTAIVDLDTGVDAGHPDYDYLQPWSGEKTLYSAKWDGVWTETRNSDTSSGHGTHVGGTIAGNGDASAGRRAGVAKGGQLVALGTGDGASIFAAEQGLEWTYQHSIPGQNEYHIRVVSNSWGTDGDYDPNGAVAQLTEMLTYDHGVAVIFAASNSGGNGGECAGGLKTNVYANTPSAISVAALTHDGSAVTSFSSRGCMNQMHTWPDVGAPGRDIWATAPRGTAIDASTKLQGDLYYMAISGTSMATPHVGGIAGLLLDAAPSLGVADYHRDDHDEGDSLVGGEGTAAYGQFEDWDTANFSRVHELELILELTARYDGMANACEAGNDDDACNDIPTECYRSATGQCHDWRIGHGLTNTDKAVALARTLQLMRDQNDDGIVDHPEYTVWDAFDIYTSLMTVETLSVDTDRVRHAWKGDWNHFNNGASGAVYYTEDSHYVWIPNGTNNLVAYFTPTEVDVETAQVGSLQMEIDLGEDGSNDAQGSGTRVSDTWIYDLEVGSEHWNTWAHFDITGQAAAFLGLFEDPEFFEASIPYTVDVALTLDLSSPVDISIPQRPDFYSDLDPTTPSDAWDDSYRGQLTFTREAYNQSALMQEILPKVSSDDDSEGFFTDLGTVLSKHAGVAAFLGLLFLLCGLGAGYALYRVNPNREDKEYVLDATIESDS